ncbi:hypothetical protein [Bacillus suaedae]|uniref:Uncharacterized protein n=1 Tax=Halalkalibacter suaedae TaxID=2822140 RepID=A0A940WPG2_9BACI|nr:hypothetical protein [Bacillus suaedae]MBP3950239.1 hypothetical protein [Bacillus suaedae]
MFFCVSSYTESLLEESVGMEEPAGDGAAHNSANLAHKESDSAHNTANLAHKSG